MRKRKNGERRFVRWIVRLFLLLILGVVLILSSPIVYAFVTYYHVPETDLEAGNWLRSISVDAKNQMCISTYIWGFPLLPDELMFKIVIDGKVIPFYELDLHDYHGQHWMDAGFPAEDFVCVTKPDLEIGQHELVFFEYRGFKWTSFRRSIFVVDEDGNVTDDFN